jgi:hypothetical protein
MDKFMRAVDALGINIAQINVMHVTALPGMPVTVRDVQVELRVL